MRPRTVTPHPNGRSAGPLSSPRHIHQGMEPTGNARACTPGGTHPCRFRLSARTRRATDRRATDNTLRREPEGASMSALDRLRALEISREARHPEPSKPTKAPFDGFVG